MTRSSGFPGVPILPHACSLLSAGDRSNIILGVLRSNHKEWGKFKDNVIKKKKNNLGEEEKYFCFVIFNKNNNKN